MEITTAKVAGDGEPGDRELAAIRLALGVRLRTLRRERELSVRALADAAGVSAGFLSQVENGHVMPSVATLIKVASALSTRVGDLFDQLNAPSRVIRAGERPAYPFSEHGVRDEILSADATGEIEVLLSTIEPGSSTGTEAYTHGTRVEVVHVISGEIDVKLGDEVTRLGPGDSITFSGDIPHGAANPGTAPAELIWITTPAGY